MGQPINTPPAPIKIENGSPETNFTPAELTAVANGPVAAIETDVAAALNTEETDCDSANCDCGN